MKVFVTATNSPAPRTSSTKQVALFLAAVYVIFAAAQLFTFEEFIELTASFNLPLGYAFASLIIVCEVFALPFLLRMKVSPAFRFLSMGLGWCVAALWTFASAWVVLTQYEILNMGFLGTVVEILPGWWAVMVALALSILTAWASWGLWPGKRKPAALVEK